MRRTVPGAILAGVRKPGTDSHAKHGWPEHERYRDAYAFATGEIGLDTSWDQLSARQVSGKRLYLASCVNCHDRGRAGEDSVAWESRQSLDR